MSQREDIVLKTLWITRKSEIAAPEMLVAWDEYSVDENSEGFEADCVSAIDSLGSDLDQWRRIDIHVFLSTIEESFKPKQARHIYAEDVTP